MPIPGPVPIGIALPGFVAGEASVSDVASGAVAAGVLLGGVPQATSATAMGSNAIRFIIFTLKETVVAQLGYLPMPFLTGRPARCQRDIPPLRLRTV